MTNRSLPDIVTYLADEIARERVRQNMRRIRREAMVTIGEAARLFGFSESQLRDWERLGLLKPVRPVESADEIRNVRRQRQYSFAELDKLAVIYELLSYGDLTPGLIAQHIDQLQHALPPVDALVPVRADENGRRQDEAENDRRYIVQRTVAAYEQLFWRHYASHVLFLAVRLLYEDVPDTSVGLILPAKKRRAGEPVPGTEHLAEVGEALVGWLGQTRSFYTFLTPLPEFEFPSDFFIAPLAPDAEIIADSDLVEDPTLIVVQRGKEARLRRTNKHVLALVRRLLAPIYEDKQDWETYFGKGMHSFAYPDMDFSSSISDALLSGFAKMVVRLGGKGPDGEDRWGFSCILLADDARLPLYQRRLVVRAASKHAHEIDGLAISSFGHYVTNLCSRAFLSSCVVLRSELAPEDPSLTFRQLDEAVLSHLAIPLGGEVEAPLGVLYVTSPFPSAFSEEDQRLLRLLARLIEEVLHTYDAKQKLAADLASLIKSPSIVDVSLREFLTENDFMAELSTFLNVLRDDRSDSGAQPVAGSRKGMRDIKDVSEVSFITIEVDDQDTIANRFGNRTLRNLSKAVGSRILRLLPALMARYTDCELYYIWSGRFYLFLRGFSLEETAQYAERLRIALGEDIVLTQSELPHGALPLSITVHIGVNWYAIEKLRDLLAKHQSVARVSALLYQSLDSVLRLGADKGGNVVFAWDRETKTYNRYPPKRSLP